MHNDEHFNIEQWIDRIANRFPPMRLFTMQDPGVGSFSRESLDELETFRALLNAYFNVHVSGVEHIPLTGGALLVGNHGRSGLDAFIFAGLGPDIVGRPVRALTNRNFFRLPKLRERMAQLGAVPGSRDNAKELLQAGELVVVYPGGHREVTKKEEDAYQLLWKGRLGFVIVAMKAGVPIIPFAGVGVEEIFHTLPAWEKVERGFLGKLIEAVTPKNLPDMPPVLVGAANSPLPSPVPLTFLFGKPIPTSSLEEGDTAQLEAFQQEVATAVTALLEEGLQDRGITRSL